VAQRRHRPPQVIAEAEQAKLRHDVTFKAFSKLETPVKHTRTLNLIDMAASQLNHSQYKKNQFNLTILTILSQVLQYLKVKISGQDSDYFFIHAFCVQPIEYRTLIPRVPILVIIVNY
jgi:hypothetical protein